MNKPRLTTMAALLAVGLIVGIGPTQAKTTSHSAQSRTKTIDVNAHYTEPAGSVDGVSLGGGADSPRKRLTRRQEEMQP